MRELLKAGALAGLAGGMAPALFMVSVGGGPIAEAIELEDSGVVVHTHDGDVFGRPPRGPFHPRVQELGGATGLLIFGLGLGLTFVVVLGVTSGKRGACGPCCP